MRLEIDWLAIHNNDDAHSQKTRMFMKRMKRFQAISYVI